MHKYLVKRMLMMVPTLIGAAILVFTLMHMIPGDVALSVMQELEAHLM
jgi:peptide/nickel transport system permease protein